MKEIWKPILELDTYYISNLGRVKNNKTGRILKQHPDKDGYYRVVLWNGKKRLNRILHRLLAQHFICNPKNKPQVNHIDGNKQNNNISNLEWATLSENRRHAFKTGLQFGKKGVLNYNAKLTEKDILNILFLLKNGAKNVDLAKKYKVHRNHISRIKRKIRWSHINDRGN